MICNSVHGYLGPRKGLHYAYCTLRRGHEPYDQHTDGLRRWEGPLLFWDEFDQKRVKQQTVRRARMCKTCGKERRTDGANNACVCKEIEVTRKQSILFVDEREKAFRAEAAKELDDDIRWLEGEWEHERIAAIAISAEPYYADF